MQESTATCKQQIPTRWNRIGYGAFIFFGVAMSILHGLEEGFMYFGIALVFDPFNQHVRWNDRPFYQKAWLVTHVAVTFVLLGYVVWSKW